MTAVVLAVAGLTAAGSAIFAILWSVAYPARRIWPPAKYGPLTPVLVWGPTLVFFGAVFALGAIGWGKLSAPAVVRYGLGGALILAGNAVVWFEVARFGLAQTGGAVGALRTSGFHRYSRNPQYLADIAIIVGWMALSAAPLAALVGFAGIVALAAAPFAEEPWLRSKYGDDYREYEKRVPRYL